MLSRQLNAIHVPHEPRNRISGVYEHAIATPTGRLWPAPQIRYQV